MNDYIKKLRQYIKANPTMFDEDCDLPALDSLYWHYGESHRKGNEKPKPPTVRSVNTSATRAPGRGHNF